MLVWGSIVLAYMLYDKHTRAGLCRVSTSILKLLCHPVGVITTAYIGMVALGLHQVGLLTSELAKDYVVWVLFGLLPLIGSVIELNSTLPKLLAETLKFSIFPLFVINEYTMDLWAELLLLPVAFLVTAALAIANAEPKFSPLRSVLNWLLTAMGFLTIGFAAWKFFHNAGDLKQLIFWEKMLLEIPGVMLHAPLLYFVQTSNLYEELLIRTHLKGFRDKSRAVWCIFKHLGMNKTNLAVAQRKAALWKVKTLADLHVELQCFRQAPD